MANLPPKGSQLIECFVFVFGLIVGSFANVLIYRLPLNQDFIFTRSYCPNCNTKINWFRNIPLLSFIFQKGRCHNCKTKISWQYPVVELSSGLLFLLAFYRLQSISFTLWPLVDIIFSVTLILVLISHFVIDLKHQILPDGLTIVLLVIFAPLGIFKLGLFQSLLGGAIGFGMTYAITWLFWKLRGVQGLGGGDIKLYGVNGLLLGPILIIHNIMFSCIFGTVLALALILSKKLKRENPFAFGPMIIITLFLQIYFPNYVQLMP